MWESGIFRSGLKDLHRSSRPRGHGLCPLGLQLHFLHQLPAPAVCGRGGDLFKKTTPGFQQDRISGRPGVKSPLTRPLGCEPIETLFVSVLPERHPQLRDTRRALCVTV